MKNALKVFILFLFAFLIVLFNCANSFSETCCWRMLGTQILFPYDKESKVSNDMGYIGTDSGWDEVFVNMEYGGGPYLKCPRIDILELMPHENIKKFQDYFKIKPVLEYMFKGKYSITGDGSPPRGYSVTLSVDLIDLARGAVVKSGKSSWTCVPREAGYCKAMRLQKTQELAKAFQPLDKFIYDYERIPESLSVDIEREPVGAGEKIKIKLKNIKDANSKPSKEWQRILVKTEKGKILNGEALGEFKVFRVGTGTVEVEYQAPNACQSDIETITIINSCHVNPNVPAIPEREIAKKKFEIFCAEGKVKITVNLVHGHMASGLLSALEEEECNYKGGPEKVEPGFLTFKIMPTKDPCIYEVEERKSIPSIYREKYVPSDPEHCCVFSYQEERLYKFSGKPQINFRKNFNKPFFLTIDNSGKAIISCLPGPSFTQSWPFGEGSQYYPNWPLKNGYVDDMLKQMTYELIIDDREVEKLIKRCRR